VADSNRSTLIVAIIGLIGTLGAAVIANWDKIAGTPDEPAHRQTVAPIRGPDDPPPPQPKKPRVVNIAGTWRDPNYPMNYSRITQDGETFRFDGAGATLQGIGFRTTGTGTVSEMNLSLDYATAYQTGQQIRGTCTGSVTSSGSRMTLTCTDPLSGTFVLSSVKD
jgi:hypothetical protein